MGNTQSVEDVNLDGKVSIVTGSNTGIGFVTAKELARMGAFVILAGRRLDKLNEAAEKIKSEVKDAKLEAMELDLSSLKSVRNFAKRFKEKDLPLHILVNNAGVMALPNRETTEDGFEKQIGTNHFGHFLLTNLLLDNIKKSGSARIINVSSAGHKMGNLDFNNLQLETGYFSWKAYGNSKLANILFTKELQRRLEGTEIDVFAVHPGFVDTELSRNMTGASIVSTFAKFIAKTPYQGALTQLKLSVDPSVKGKGGTYWADCVQVEPSSSANDMKAAAQLWEVSEKLTEGKGLD